MKKWNEDENFTDEQNSFIERFEDAYNKSNDYLLDNEIVSSFFINGVSFDEYNDCFDEEYSFRKLSEYAVDGNTVISKVIVTNEYNRNMEPLIMFTRSKVDHLDDKWMDFLEIKPIFYRKPNKDDAFEWMMKRDIWDHLDWHKQNSFLGKEVMVEDLRFLEYVND